MCRYFFKNLFVLRLVSELDWKEPDLLMVVTSGLALSRYRYLRGYCWYLLTEIFQICESFAMAGESDNVVSNAAAGSNATGIGANLP